MSASAIKIALASKAAATKIRPKETTWTQLCKKLAYVNPGLKDGPGWIPADIDSGPRLSDRVRSVSVLALDIERKNETPPPDLDWIRCNLDLLDYDAHVHTTYNHDPENPRYRIIFRLAEPMPPAMLKKALSAIADRAGLSDCWDRQCSDPARLFYRPRCPEGREHLFQSFTIKGRPLTLREIQQMTGQASNANVLPFSALPVDTEAPPLVLPETPENIERVSCLQSLQTVTVIFGAMWSGRCCLLAGKMPRISLVTGV